MCVLVFGAKIYIYIYRITYPNWFGITGYPPARSPAAKGNPAVGRPTEKKQKKRF